MCTASVKRTNGCTKLAVESPLCFYMVTYKITNSVENTEEHSVQTHVVLSTLTKVPKTRMRLTEASESKVIKTWRLKEIKK